MEEKVTLRSHFMLGLNTLAFVICFACWMLNGVLVTFLADHRVYDWGPVEVGWLLGIPVLTGSLFRLPVGILTDKFGGKWVFGGLLLFCSIPMFLLSYADSFSDFAILSFLYGIIGSGFAVGIAYTSVWYPKKWQGTALGIVGAGNAGAAITTTFAPSLLLDWSADGDPDQVWRSLPQWYAYIMISMGLIFLLFAKNKKTTGARRKLGQMLTPLKNIRVWRFGLYYFLVFGCFVAFSQWLVPYFLNVYGTSLIMAGILTSLFSFPSGAIRALGGWMSDRWGARRVMYWVLGTSLGLSLLLIFPRMEIHSPGRGIMAMKEGKVTEASDSLIVIGEDRIPLSKRSAEFDKSDARTLILPTKEMWQEPVVKVGDLVKKKQLVAKATTRIYFQANIWVFVVLVTLIGIVWGIGKAAVYKHIPEYFPEEVGVVGGMVGVIGGLGGFVCPILFGYLLDLTGIWTSSWILMWLISGIALFWMHLVITGMLNREVPHLAKHLEPTGKSS